MPGLDRRGAGRCIRPSAASRTSTAARPPTRPQTAPGREGMMVVVPGFAVVTSATRLLVLRSRCRAVIRTSDTSSARPNLTTGRGTAQLGAHKPAVRRATTLEHPAAPGRATAPDTCDSAGQPADRGWTFAITVAFVICVPSSIQPQRATAFQPHHNRHRRDAVNAVAGFIACRVIFAMGRRQE